MNDTRRKELRAFRRGRRQTQKQFAEQIGYSTNQYCKIERGERDGSLDFWQTVQDTFSIEDSDMWELIKKG